MDPTDGSELQEPGPIMVELVGIGVFHVFRFYMGDASVEGGGQGEEIEEEESFALAD